MSIKNFFKRALLGQETELRISDNPFPKEEILVQETPAEPPALLHREEILDDRNRICGYRFQPSNYGDGTPMSARRRMEALRNESVGQFAQRRLALVPLAIEDWHQADFAPLIGIHTTFSFSVPPGPIPDTCLEILTAVKAKGARIALKNLDAIEDHANAIALADLALFDFHDYALDRLEERAKALMTRNPALSLAIEGLDAWPERKLCGSLGFRYFLGSFTTTRDEAEPEGEISQSRLILIEMLNQLRRDADLSALADVAKRDPVVSMHVLSMANSPMAGLSQPVASLDQAIMVLGREYLYRWLAISMFRTGSGSELDETLLELALTRARMLELLGQANHGKQECDELFLVGLLSLMDTLLRQPMEKLLARMHLPPTVAQVLLKSEGPYGRYLMLAIALEKDRIDQVARLAPALGLNVADMERAGREARQWAEEAVKSSRS